MKNNSYSLATLIQKEIAKDFEKKHLSGNYVKTMKTQIVDKRSAIIRIPAPKYDMEKFIFEKIIINVGGSYATELEKEGSKIVYKNGEIKHLGNHQNVVSKGIKKGIIKFIKKGKKGQIEVWKIKN